MIPTWSQKQGTALLHLASCFNLLDVVEDETPIFSLEGEELALIVYSLSISVFRKDRTAESLLKYEDMS